MSNGKSWYETGYEGSEREAEKSRLGFGPSTFWLKSGAKRELIFIDDSPFCFWKHQWKTADSKRPEFATCTTAIHNECAPCAKGNKSDYTGHLTVVDCTGYVKDNKEQGKYELVEFCPKNTVMGKLKTKKEIKGSILGRLWLVSRTGDMSPSTGDDFDEIREVDMKGLYNNVTYKGKKIKDRISLANGTGPEAEKERKYLAHHFSVPSEGKIPEVIPVFNYANLHAPMTPAEMVKAFAGAVSYQSGGFSGGAAGGSAKADEDTPF